MRGRVIRKAGHAAVINNQNSILRYLLFPLEHRCKTDAVEGGSPIDVDFAKIKERGKNVLYLSKTTNIARFTQASVGPTDKTGHPMHSLPDLGLFSPHPGIEILRSE